MSNINLNISKKIFNDIYYPHLFDYSYRYNVYYGGAGSGKSVFVFQMAIIKALKMPRRILVVRKVGRTQENSTFKTIIDILVQFKLYQHCKINKTTMRIELPNGSEFIFSGMDDSEKIKSIAGITDIICEEATELTREDVVQLDLRLRPQQPNPQIFYMFNPTSKANWTFKTWFSEGAAYDKSETLIVKSTYKDNKFLSDAYIKALENKIKTDPTYYKIYALGEFCSLDKLIYNNWRIENFDRTAANFRELKLICGLDWGFTNDPSTLVCSLLDDDEKRIYVFQEWYERGKTNPEIANIITSLGYAKSIIVADSAEQKSIEEIKRLGISRIKAAVKGPDSIIHGIQRLQEYEIVVHPSCINVINELENYSWQKDRDGEYINKPQDNFNHCLDALRYSLQCYDKGQLKLYAAGTL